MDDFLRKMQLSEHAIKIYLKSLGKFPLSYYELYTIVPKATQEEFNESLNELINRGLLLLQSNEKESNVVQYLPLPPILPILNYYENINANLANIKSSIRELMINSINNIFQDNKIIEVDKMLRTFQEINEDINEDAIIQKQEVEDIVKGMEEINIVKEKLSTLHQNVMNIAKDRLTDLIKTLNNLKVNLVDEINSMDFKRHKEEIISLIEKVFKKKIDDKLSDFTDNLYDLIENEFNETGKPLESTTDLIIRYQNDFKMLLLNMLSNFETKMNKIYDLLKENQDEYSSNVKTFEINLAENLNTIIQNSVDEISNLNKPIENVIKYYFQEIRITNKDLFKNVWIINSITKINEIIQDIIVNSKDTLMIIIPHIENHLAIEQFKDTADNLKIKIAASEAHTNSIVRSFKSIPTIIYKTYRNENLISLKSDNNLLIIGVIQDSNNPLNDFIGFATSFEPLIKILDPIINSLWENAFSDSFHAAQVTKTQASMEKPLKTLTSIKPIIRTNVQSEKVGKKIVKVESEKRKPAVEVPGKIQEIPKSDKRAIKDTVKQTPVPVAGKPQITDLKQKLKEKIDFVVAAKPKTGDESAIEINAAFANLTQKLDKLKGDQFGEELQNIADLILEKKGFSVTLHKLRSMINKYKEKLTLLDVNDKKEILENIENWKQKLF